MRAAGVRASASVIANLVLGVAPVLAAAGAASDPPVRQVAAGEAHTLMLESDGTVWAWGSNAYGQLGDGTTADRHEPVQVRSLNRMTSIAAGRHHSIAVAEDGSIWVWGNNSFGQLGDGTTVNRLSPVRLNLPKGEAAPVRGTSAEAAEPSVRATARATEVAAIDESGKYKVAMSPDGRHVLLGSESQKEVALARADGEVLWTHEIPDGVCMEDGAVARDGRLVVVGGQGRGVSVFSRSGDHLWNDTDVRGECQVAVSDDGTKVFAGFGRELICYDAEGEPLWTRSVDTKGWTIWDIDATPDGGTLLVRTNSDVFLFDGEGEQKAFHDIVEGNHLVSAAIASDAAAFAVGYALDDDNYVALHSADGKQRWRQKVDSYADVALDGQNRLFATVRGGKNLAWNAGGELILEWPNGGHSISASDDGRYCAVGRSGKRPAVYEITYGADASPGRGAAVRAEREAIEENDDYVRYPASSDDDWEKARKSADQLAGQRSGRGGDEKAALIVAKFELSDPGKERAVDVRTSGADLYRVGSSGYSPGGNVVKNGEIIILRQRPARIGDSKASVNVGTLFHRSFELPLAFESGKTVELGTIRAKPCPADKTGRLTIQLHPEKGLDLAAGEALRIGRHFSHGLSSSYEIDADGRCVLEGVAAGSCLVKAMRRDGFAAPYQRVTVEAGEENTLDVDVWRLHDVEVEWACRLGPAAEWSKGSKTWRSGESWYLRNDLRDLTGNPYGYLSDWTEDGAEIRFSQCDWSLLGKGELADYLDLVEAERPDDYARGSGTLYAAEGMVFRLAKSGSTSGEPWTVLVRIGNIQPVDPAEAPASGTGREAVSSRRANARPAVVRRPTPRPASRTNRARLDVGDPAPDLHIAEWIKGEPVSLAEGKGKNVYVVEFWATWCGPCRASIPHLTELQERFRDDRVVIVSISDETAEKIRPFVDKQGDEMGFTVAADKDGKTKEAWMRAAGQGGIPHAFLVDRDGKIAWHGHPTRGLDEEIERVLDKNAR